MFDRLKLAIYNLKFILTDADLLAMRFALNIGSISWAVWVAVSMIMFPSTLDDFDLPFVDAQLPMLATLFAIHGTVGVIALLLHQRNRFWIILGSMYGALLWTISLNIITIVRFSEQSLPMGGAHWLAAFIAWWIFIHDIFGRNNNE